MRASLTSLVAAAAIAALVVTLVAAAPGHAQPASPAVDPEVAARADGHLARGLELYGSGDFESAIAEFQAGYQLDPRPDFLFAAAQAERRSGDCASAIVYYDRFLATSPSEAREAAAIEQRDRCHAALGSSPRSREPALPPPPPPAADAEDAPPAAARLPSAPPPAAASSSPWWHDPVTDVALGGGVGLVAVGTVLLLSADQAAADANAATTYEDYQAAVDRIGPRRTFGVITGVAGVAAIGFATWRILRHGGGERASESATAFAIDASASSVSVALGGRF